MVLINFEIAKQVIATIEDMRSRKSIICEFLSNSLYLQKGAKMKLADFSIAELTSGLDSNHRDCSLFVRIKNDTNFELCDKIGGIDSYGEGDYSYFTIENISLDKPLCEQLNGVPLKRVEFLSFSHLSIKL